MVKRICALLLALLLLTAGSSLADLKLTGSTPAQKSLKTYLENVNAFLTESGEQEINHIFDQLDEVAELGVTSSDDAYEPEKERWLEKACVPDYRADGPVPPGASGSV